MSKIFDALNKAGSDASGDLLRALGDVPAAPEPLVTVPAAPEQANGPLPAPKLNGEGLGTEPTMYALSLAPNSPLLPFDGTPNRVSEEYRIIRTKIFQHPKQPRMIVVSSAGPNEGKSVTAINLAGVLSLKSNARVLLLDTDFRRSSIAATLGLPSTPGLTDVLTGKCEPEKAIFRAEQLPNLYIVPAGTSPYNPAELLDSPLWLQLCRNFRARFEHIILDSPPIPAVADYELIQAVADAVIVVVRPDFTSRTSFDAAIKTIPPEKLIGIVMNWVPEWFLSKRRSYGYSYYEGLRS
jgi:capsular exopolysaccharide synthesis family protein